MTPNGMNNTPGVTPPDAYLHQVTSNQSKSSNTQINTPIKIKPDEYNLKELVS